MTTLRIRRSDAKTAGLTRYFTGVACSRGHIAERAVSNGTCWECKPINARASSRDKEKARQRNREWKARNPDQAKIWYQRNSDQVKARTARWKVGNPDRAKALAKRWAQENHDLVKSRRQQHYRSNRAKYIARAAEWLKANPDRRREIDAKRYASETRATPVWADKNAIKRIYAKAVHLSQTTGIPHEVDHIVPLRSKWVCGLHCQANLQVISKQDNLIKGNRFWPSMVAATPQQGVTA